MAAPLMSTKVCIPTLNGVVARTRLLEEIDAMRERGRRLVWLAGAPGSGKTTLAAAYVEHCGTRALWLRVDAVDADPASLLGHCISAAEHAGNRGGVRLPALTREHLADVEPYARLLFRALFAGRAPLLIVLDDVHAISGRAACERIVAVLVDELPDGSCLLATSREPSPAALARLFINGVAEQLPGGALAFTVDETRRLLVARHGDPDAAEALHASTLGWAAALALRVSARAGACPALDFDARRQLDAYLDAEVFAALDERERRGLLMLALLPSVRQNWAAALRVPDGARRRLQAMAEDGILVQTYAARGDEVEYRFHPLFAEFLRERMLANLTPRQLRATQRTVASLLQRGGAVEAALDLRLELRQWRDACKLIIAAAPAALAAARQHSVVSWAEGVPECRRSAWLQFWLGQAQMLSNPARGREHVIKAYEVFKRERDFTSCYRALAAILATYFFEYSTLAPMSRWLAEFHALGLDYDALPGDDVKALVAVGVWSALVVREPQHLELPLWESRMHAMLALDVDPNVKVRGAMLLAKHYWYSGQHERAWPLAGKVAGELDKPGLMPYARLVWHLLLQYDAWSRGDAPAGRLVGAQAVELAERCGIHLLDGHLQLHAACFALAQGDVDDAAKLLMRAEEQHNPARRLEAWHLYATKAWAALLAGDHARALEHASIALDAAEPIGPPPQCTALVGICHALLASGDAARLAPQLERLARLAASSGNRWASFHVELIAARLAQCVGDPNRAREHTAKAFAIGRRHSLYCFLYAEPKALAHVCAEALAAGIEVEYVRELIRRQRLAPPTLPALRDAWCWPVRIDALGRFMLLIGDRPLAWNGKAQKKTLELMKVLVALGGRDVDTGTLADALWPDADGDAARSALDMALHRLRKLLGRDDAVLVRESKASLNPEVCWLDVWAFESGLEHGEARALALYRGALLASEPDSSWLLPARERLRQRHLRAVLGIGRAAEERGEWSEAAALYESALEHDGVAEEVYRRLMLCHLQRHDEAATVATWRRCRSMLSVVLGVRPSPETEAVYRRVAASDSLRLVGQAR
jgi:ATP/maltotriose-dependent transcriptional regulator MalT/DNA-binding SARP family transcriptional activator